MGIALVRGATLPTQSGVMKAVTSPSAKMVRPICFHMSPGKMLTNLDFLNFSATTILFGTNYREVEIVSEKTHPLSVNCRLILIRVAGVYQSITGHIGENTHANYFPSIHPSIM